MKKKLLPVILSISIFFAGCGTPSETVVERSSESTHPVSSETELTPSSMSDTLANEKLLSVEVTIPAIFYEYEEDGGEMTQEKVDQIVSDNGFKSGILNSDGSVTFSMSKSQHAEFLQSLKDATEETASDFVDGDDRIESFTKITFNDDLSEFKIYIDPAAYTDFDSISAITFYFAGQYYQLFSGIPFEDTEVIIEFIDKDTNEVITTGSLSQFRENIQSSGESESAETANETAEGSENAPESIASISEQVVFDQDEIKITATGLESDGSLFGAEVNFLIENNSEQNITVQARGVSVNGYMVDTSMSADVATGKKNNTSMTIMGASLEECGISAIADIEFSFHILDAEEWETIADSEVISLHTSIVDSYTQEYDESGEVIYEDENVRIISKDIASDDIWGPSAVFYIENISDTDLTVQARDTSVNGFMVSPSFSPEISAGKRIISNMTFLSTDLEENNIEEISDIETTFHIFTTSDWETIVDTEPITINY